MPLLALDSQGNPPGAVIHTRPNRALQLCVYFFLFCFRAPLQSDRESLRYHSARAVWDWLISSPRNFTEQQTPRTHAKNSWRRFQIQLLRHRKQRRSRGRARTKTTHSARTRISGHTTLGYVTSSGESFFPVSSHATSCSTAFFPSVGSKQTTRAQSCSRRYTPVPAAVADDARRYQPP